MNCPAQIRRQVKRETDLTPVAGAAGPVLKCDNAQLNGRPVAGLALVMCPQIPPDEADGDDGSGEGADEGDDCKGDC
jgi:hypothetical protein